jgi:hypothetical protein
MPLQWNILVRLLMPSYGRKGILRKKVMSSTWSSGKCIGCLDAILSCWSTINSHYTSKLYVHFWSYGIQLWGCASDSNIEVYCQAPWYVRNGEHRDPDCYRYHR